MTKGMFNGELFKDPLQENFFGGMAAKLIITADQRRLPYEVLMSKIGMAHSFNDPTKDNLSLQFQNDVEYSWVPEAIHDFEQTWQKSHKGKELTVLGKVGAGEVQSLLEAFGFLIRFGYQQEMRENDLLRWGSSQSAMRK